MLGWAWWRWWQELWGAYILLFFPKYSLQFNFFFLFCGTRVSHCCGLSHCGAQAPDAQAQQPWLTGLAALRHVGSSRTGTRTRVPWIGRRTLNHCASGKPLPEILFFNPQCSHLQESTLLPFFPRYPHIQPAFPHKPPKSHSFMLI